MVFQNFNSQFNSFPIRNNDLEQTMGKYAVLKLSLIIYIQNLNNIYIYFKALKTFDLAYFTGK